MAALFIAQATNTPLTVTDQLVVLAQIIARSDDLTRIVQAADFNDQLDDRPAARGLQLIGRGFPQR